MFDSKKGQGSLEYMVIIVAVLAVSAVVVYFIAGHTKASVSSANIAECRNAAEQCNANHLVNVNDPCDFCESACTVGGVDILNNNCSFAVNLCRQGKSSAIYFGHTRDGCFADSDCDDGNNCTIDSCVQSAASSCIFDCNHTQITSCSDGDGCCPSGCTHNDDSDCNNIAPVLTNSGVNHQKGLTKPNYNTSSRSATSFIFSVKYSDADNDTPSYVKVKVSGASHNMHKEDSNCDDYINGCVYVSNPLTFGGESAYKKYYFTANDSINTTTLNQNSGITLYECGGASDCHQTSSSDYGGSHYCRDYTGCSYPKSSSANCDWDYAHQNDQCKDPVTSNYHCCGGTGACSATKSSGSSNSLSSYYNKNYKNLVCNNNRLLLTTTTSNDYYDQCYDETDYKCDNGNCQSQGTSPEEDYCGTWKYCDPDTAGCTTCAASG